MKKEITLLLLSLYSLAAISQSASSLEKFVNRPALQSAGVSVYVKNLNTQEVLAQHNIKQMLAPASTQKLLTTTTALEILGPDFRYSTFIETDGKIEDGILYGNLYVRGTGDPTLGSQQVGYQGFLNQWVRAVKDAGIRHIKGDIVADVAFFDGDAINPRWIWEDIGNYYAPGIYALPYLDNTLNIQLRSRAVGTVAEVVKTLPYIEGLEFENHIRCTEITYDGAFVHGLPYQNRRYLVGSIPSNQGIFGVKGDIPNPPLLLITHFSQYLQASNIKVEGVERVMTESTFPQRELIYEHQSEPLIKILKEVNQNSNNLYAEQVFRILASKIAVPCTINNASHVIRSCWRNRGVNLNQCFIEDGCGLSPQDGLTADALVQLLQFMNKSPQRQNFISTLPVAGQSGTLRGFLAGTPLQGKLCAKSGTTSRIKSYAGYITMPNGETLAFAVIVNNATTKPRNTQAMIEQLLLGIYQQEVH